MRLAQVQRLDRAIDLLRQAHLLAQLFVPLLVLEEGVARLGAVAGLPAVFQLTIEEELLQQRMAGAVRLMLRLLIMQARRADQMQFDVAALLFIAPWIGCSNTSGCSVA